jgi:L-rhamnose-H+ transport protein
METAQVGLGLFLGIIAGAFLGTFPLPMKRTLKWNWEQTWFTFTVWSAMIFPWMLAFMTVPNLLSVFSAVSVSTMLTVFGFGAGWGIGSIGMGVGIKTLGISLGTAIVLGLNNVIGAILPLIMYHPEKFLQPVGLAVTGGVCVMLIGIVICAVAGAKKDKAVQNTKDSSSKKHTAEFVKGLVMCLIAGVCGAMFNFALISGKSIENIAVKMGASPINAANPTWCIGLLGGGIVVSLYCFYLAKTNKSWNLFTQSGITIYWFYTFLMGIMWFSGVALYGMAVTKLGVLGASIGWPIIQSMAVASGNFWGIVTGEWKNTGKKPLQTMLFGLLFLFIGIAIIGWSSTLS